MHPSLIFDIGGPGLLYAAAGSIILVLIASIMIVAIESLILWKLGWGTFWRSILVGLVMNFSTTLLGFGFITSLVFFFAFLGINNRFRSLGPGGRWRFDLI